MQNDNDNLSVCEQALATYALRLSGEELTAEQAQSADQHIAGCESCRKAAEQTAQITQWTCTAFVSVKVSSGFAARTMAALPASTTPSIPQNQPRVYGNPAPVRFPWRAAAIAASVAVLVAGGLIVLRRTSFTVVVARTQTGALVDSRGNAIHEIKSGQVYSARQNSVVNVEGAGTLNVMKGTQFQFRPDQSKGPQMELQSGDVYANATGNDGVRVACVNFQTEVPEGDCFVTQEVDSIPRGVVILFNGRAKVTPNLQDSLALSPGQVFFSIGEGVDAFTDTLQIVDVPKLSVAEKTESKTDKTALRNTYAERVAGYKQELAELKKREAEKTAGDPEKTELATRAERISSYLRVHELRLKSLAKADIPLGEIQRGIDGHTDPQTWR
jgi:hypothetical protein